MKRYKKLFCKKSNKQDSECSCIGGCDRCFLRKSEMKHIIWIADYCYKKANPESKMCTPNIVYEQVGKDYKKFLNQEV